jgi:hypothetical protein
VFENRAWLPTTALLTDSAAQASELAGPEVLVRADLSGATPVFVGADQLTTAVETIDAGVVHVAVPFDDNWSLSVDGTSVPARRAFGDTTAFDVTTAGVGELRYESPISRLLLVFLQVAFWIAALVIVSRVQVPTGRRTDLATADEPLIDLSAGPLFDLAVESTATTTPAPDPHASDQ